MYMVLVLCLKWNFSFNFGMSFLQLLVFLEALIYVCLCL